MKKAYIKRLNSTEFVTTGIFFYEFEDRVWTLGSLELPWKNNKKSVSCIPTGIYTVQTTYSPKYKKPMWLVKNVPNRSGIRIHSANYTSDLEGCIALGGTSLDMNKDGIMDVGNSRVAIELAHTHLGDLFELEIM